MMRIANCIVLVVLAGCSFAGCVADPDDGPGPCIRGSVWKSTSTSVSMRSFGFFDGSSGYERNRSSMTAEQLEALEGLCPMPIPTSFGTDGVHYTIEITDRDGSIAVYSAAGHDIFESTPQHPALAYASLAPFLGTFKCLSAAQTRPITQDPVTPPWRDAPDVNVDPGCRNGIFMPYKCYSVWLKLNVPVAASHRLELERCYETLGLEVFTADGMTKLAASDPITGGACAALTHAFEAGSYLVRVDKSNGDASCDAGMQAGDFFLRVGTAAP
jgi:hypothetical protein